MDLSSGNDGADGLQRGHDAGTPVIVQGKLAIFGGRIAPGDAEDGVALSDQIADERILRRQIEDVVLHDPGRHDQHRLGHDRLRRRRILNQFDQVVPVNDLSGRDGDVPADPEILGAHRGLPGDKPADVLHPVLEPADEVGPAGLDGLLDYFGVGEREVRGREHVEELARGEGHHLLMVRRDAGHFAGDVVPPLLIEQEGLSQEIVGLLVPSLGAKPVVARQRLDARRRIGIARCSCAVSHQTSGFP